MDMRNVTHKGVNPSLKVGGGGGGGGQVHLGGSGGMPTRKILKPENPQMPGKCNKIY